MHYIFYYNKIWGYWGLVFLRGGSFVNLRIIILTVGLLSFFFRFNFALQDTAAVSETNMVLFIETICLTVNAQKKDSLIVENSLEKIASALILLDDVLQKNPSSKCMLESVKSIIESIDHIISFEVLSTASQERCCVAITLLIKFIKCCDTDKNKNLYFELLGGIIHLLRWMIAVEETQEKIQNYLEQLQSLTALLRAGVLHLSSDEISSSMWSTPCNNALRACAILAKNNQASNTQVSFSFAIYEDIFACFDYVKGHEVSKKNLCLNIAQIGSNFSELLQQRSALILMRKNLVFIERSVKIIYEIDAYEMPACVDALQKLIESISSLIVNDAFSDELLEDLYKSLEVLTQILNVYCCKIVESNFENSFLSNAIDALTKIISALADRPASKSYVAQEVVSLTSILTVIKMLAEKKELTGSDYRNISNCLFSYSLMMSFIVKVHLNNAENAEKLSALIASTLRIANSLSACIVGMQLPVVTDIFKGITASIVSLNTLVLHNVNNENVSVVIENSCDTLLSFIVTLHELVTKNSFDDSIKELIATLLHTVFEAMQNIIEHPECNQKTFQTIYKLIEQNIQIVRYLTNNSHSVELIGLCAELIQKIAVMYEHIYTKQIDTELDASCIVSTLLKDLCALSLQEYNNSTSTLILMRSVVGVLQLFKKMVFNKLLTNKEIVKNSMLIITIVNNLWHSIIKVDALRSLLIVVVMLNVSIIRAAVLNFSHDPDIVSSCIVIVSTMIDWFKEIIDQICKSDSISIKLLEMFDEVLQTFGALGTLQSTQQKLDTVAEYILRIIMHVHTLMLNVKNSKQLNESVQRVIMSIVIALQSCCLQQGIVLEQPSIIVAICWYSMRIANALVKVQSYTSIQAHRLYDYYQELLEVINFILKYVQDEQGKIKILISLDSMIRLSTSGMSQQLLSENSTKLYELMDNIYQSIGNIIIAWSIEEVAIDFKIDYQEDCLIAATMEEPMKIQKHSHALSDLLQGLLGYYENYIARLYRYFSQEI